MLTTNPQKQYSVLTACHTPNTVNRIPGSPAYRSKVTLAPQHLVPIPSLIIRSTGILVRCAEAFLPLGLNFPLLLRGNFALSHHQIARISSTLASSGKATAAMAHPSGSGGTSLAPTPTQPHHLSRESSREELEMAESLRRLNQVQDAHMSNTGSPLREQQPGTPPDDQKSEIYHSLEDAVPIAGSLASPAPTTTLSLPPRSVGGNSAPIIGQVCRYVAWPV